MYISLMHQFQHRIVVVHETQPVRDLLKVAPQARHTPKNHRRMSGGLGAGQGREARTDCCWCWRQWSDVERCHHIPAGGQKIFTFSTQWQCKIIPNKELETNNSY